VRCSSALLPAAGEQVIERVFHLTQPQTQQSLQGMLTVIRIVANIRESSIQPDQKSVAVRGTSDEGRFAEWITAALDQPDSVPQEYAMAGTGGEKVRVFSLTHLRTPRDLQEMVTLIRSLADAQNVCWYTPRNAAVLRGNAWRVDLAEWMIRKLDRPPNEPPPTTSQEYRLPGGCDILPPEDVFVRIFCTRARTPEELTAILTELRLAVKPLARSFTSTARGAVIVRASAAKIAAAEQALQQRQ
jgi:hypothetical protein